MLVFAWERVERNIAMRCDTLGIFVQTNNWEEITDIKSFTCNAPFSDSLAGWFCNLGGVGVDHGGSLVLWGWRQLEFVTLSYFVTLEVGRQRFSRVSGGYWGILHC